MRERPDVREFQCPGCGRPEIALCFDPRVQLRCERCRMSPGWHRRPEAVTSYALDAALMAAGEAAALTCEAM